MFLAPQLIPPTYEELTAKAPDTELLRREQEVQRQVGRPSAFTAFLRSWILLGLQSSVPWLERWALPVPSTALDQSLPENAAPDHH